MFTRAALKRRQTRDGAQRRGQRLLKLRANERGAAIIELALIAPVFALMVVGIVDMSNAYSRKLGLEQGAQRAMEKIMQTTQGDTVDGTIVTEVMCQVNGVNTDGTCKTSPIAATDVTVSDRLECIDSDGTVNVMADPTDDCAANQTQTRYKSVTVVDKYTPMFPVHFAALNSDGTYHLSATAGMRTQ